MKFTMLTRLSLFIAMLLGTCVLGAQAYASRIYIEAPTGLVYDCPFDVRVMVDTQGEEIMWASLNFDLASGLDLLGLSFSETFKMSYPVQKADNNVKAYAFKFPGTISWVYDFATLRLSQRNVWTGTSALNFIFAGTGDTTDFMDVYYFGGADLLTQIDNTDFAFTQWPCAYAPSELSWDMLSPNFDSKAHMSAIQDMIDQFEKSQGNQFMAWISTYWYFVLEGLALLFLIVFLSMWSKRRHKKA